MPAISLATICPLSFETVHARVVCVWWCVDKCVYVVGVVMAECVCGVCGGAGGVWVRRAKCEWDLLVAQLCLKQRVTGRCW
jgi:hypothetical protein